MPGKAFDCILDQPANETWVGEEGSLTKVDVGEYSPEPTFFLEAVVDASDVDRVQVRLVADSGQVVDGSTVGASGDAPTRVRSGPIDLDGAREYRFQVRVADADNDLERGEVHMVKLLSKQAGAEDTVTTVKVSGADSNRETEEQKVSRRSAIWRYNATAFDGAVDVHFEAVANLAGTCMIPCPAEVHLVRARDGRTVASVQFGFKADTQRRRTGDISGSLEPREEYEVRLDRGEAGNELFLDLARVVVEQDDLDRTLRYVDLSWQDRTRSTSFVDVGYPAVHHASGDGSPVEGFFEATMEVDTGVDTASPLVALAGETATARLTNASAGGAAVDGSEISTASTSPTRVRTDGPVTLDPSSTGYRAQLRTSQGLVDAEIRNAWIVRPQAGGLR